MKRIAIAVLASACGGSAAPPPAPVGNAVAPTASACLVDRMAEPPAVPPRRLECTGVEERCQAQCDQGQPVACVSLGYVFDAHETGTPEAAALYRRGCELGDLNGCTNYGTYLLDGVGGLTADPVCAARLHQRACEGGDAYGCGMFGRELALGVGVEADVARARSLLETSCAALGSFACHVLGIARENGYFGEVDLPGAAEAYQRFCDTDEFPSCPDAERLAAGAP